MGAIWITLGLVNLSMMVSEASFGGSSPLPLAALVSLLSGALLFLIGQPPACPLNCVQQCIACMLASIYTASILRCMQMVSSAGVWALLQFRWLQLQYPVVALAFEKLLLGACIPVGVAVLSWGCLAAVGPTQTPFHQAAILAGSRVLAAGPGHCTTCRLSSTALGAALCCPVPPQPSACWALDEGSELVCLPMQACTICWQCRWSPRSSRAWQPAAGVPARMGWATATRGASQTALACRHRWREPWLLP